MIVLTGVLAAAVYDLPSDNASMADGPERSPSAGMLVDTPGVRELAVDMNISELSWYFPEFEKFSPSCKFNDCTHTHEPSCAVIGAAEQGLIPPGRYERYLRLVDSLA